jgi:hypothetical protein
MVNHGLGSAGLTSSKLQRQAKLGCQVLLWNR